jgi:hypothetical protein
VGLYVQEPQKWIPQRDTPIRPTGPTTQTFRAEMASHFEPILPGDKPPIRISQTQGTLFTSPVLIAFLNQDTVAVAPPGVRIANRQQINSPALYGSYPGEPWPIRTELLSVPAELNGHRETLPRIAVVATFHPVLNSKN